MMWPDFFSILNCKCLEKNRDFYVFTTLIENGY